MRIENRIQVADWGRMVWLLEAQSCQTIGPDMSLARMEVNVGATSEPHRHANCHESLHLLEGQICEYIDGEAFDMEAGETVFIPQNAVHYTQNTGEEVAVMMISYSQGMRDYTKA